MTSVYRSTYAKQDKDGRRGRDSTAVLATVQIRF